MAADSKSNTIEKHLAHARELNVSLEEYAEAYDVDLADLKAASGEVLLSDFVAVKVEPSQASGDGCLCSMTNAQGARIEFHVWPSVDLLMALWGGQS